MLLPGTVAATSNALNVAEVSMDGDPDGIVVAAQLLMQDVGEGDRVMVMFDPPQGVFVIGTIARRSESGMVVGLSEADFEDEFTCTGGCLSSVAFPDIEFIGQAGRQYRFDYTISIEKTASLVAPAWWIETGMFGMRLDLYLSGIGGITDMSDDLYKTIISYSRVIPYQESIAETIECSIGFYVAATDTFTVEGSGQFRITDAGPLLPSEP